MLWTLALRIMPGRSLASRRLISWFSSGIDPGVIFIPRRLYTGSRPCL